MKITGQEFCDVLTRRIKDQRLYCLDTDIVRLLRELTAEEIQQVASFGEVVSWHNERLNEPLQNMQQLP